MSQKERVREATRIERVRRDRRHGEEPKRIPINILKGKIPPFLGDRGLNYLDYNYMVKVKLITLGFEGYTLIWWNQIACDIRSLERAPIES
ncbi:hypothetical protein CR513_43452, partial [Mucuna pruriens]